MINLIEIERAIDEALAKETRESLLEWLKCQKNSQSYLGEGEFIASGFKDQHIQIQSKIQVSSISEDDESDYANTAFAMAA